MLTLLVWIELIISPSLVKALIAAVILLIGGAIIAAVLGGALNISGGRKLDGLLTDLIVAETKGDEEKICEAAQKIKDYIESHNLESDKAKDALEKAEAVLEDCESETADGDGNSGNS